MTYCPLEQEEDKAYDCFTRFPVSGHRLGLLYIMVSISICGEQTGNELKLQSITLPSTGHAGDLGDTQLQPRGPRRSTCLDLPGDLVLERLSHLNLLGDLPVQGPQEAQSFVNRSSSCVHFSSVQFSCLLSHVRLFVIP